ncbi:hypothetical protein ANN_13335 [Periplaneta americana]|uniref:Uncharacterized protein n=1 Tax=Periplaneta americana TaxID=6978 RepID=A0ABQ8TJ57_PERAM|nr:hypothetical protein ANN_13335 [Periplaneta americana]
MKEKETGKRTMRMKSKQMKSEKWRRGKTDENARNRRREIGREVEGRGYNGKRRERRKKENKKERENKVKHGKKEGRGNVEKQRKREKSIERKKCVRIKEGIAGENENEMRKKWRKMWMERRKKWGKEMIRKLIEVQMREGEDRKEANRNIANVDMEENGTCEVDRQNKNETVLERVDEEGMMLKLIRKRKRNWLGHW